MVPLIQISNCHGVGVDCCVMGNVQIDNSTIFRLDDYAGVGRPDETQLFCSINGGTMKMKDLHSIDTNGGLSLFTLPKNVRATGVKFTPARRYNGDIQPISLLDFKGTGNEIHPDAIFTDVAAGFTIGGSGSMFVPEELKSDEITAGQTGLLLSEPEVSGKVYKITRVHTGGNDEQAGMSLIIDGVTVFNEKNLMDVTPTTNSMQATGDSFGVSQDFTVSNLVSGVRVINEIYCSSFSLIKNTGNTTEGIDYAYQVGSFK